MTDLRTAAQQALEALEEFGTHYKHCPRYPTWARPELQPPCDCGYDNSMSVIRAALEQPEQPNPWRDAVDHELSTLHMVASDDPRESIRRLIDWHCAVQIDPLVSSAAQELIERGRREALEQPEQEPVADRAAFERHAESLGYSVDKAPTSLADSREGPDYWNIHTHLMWKTWQAALEQPERATVKESLPTGEPPKFEAVPYPEVQPYPFEMPPLTPEQLARVSAGMRALKLTMTEVEQPEQETLSTGEVEIVAKAMRRLREAEQEQEPVAIVEMVVPHLESIVTKHILGARFPKVGDFLYADPPRRQWRSLKTLDGPEPATAGQRCKTCKHWSQFSKAYPFADMVAPGICKSSKLDEDQGQFHGADMLVYRYSEGGQFWTGPEFGCVHHEERA